MLAYHHSGFSVDAGVCIEAHDHARADIAIFGVLAPNSPLRSAAVAMAALAQSASAQAGRIGTGEGSPGVAAQGNTFCGGAQLPQPQPIAPKPSPAPLPMGGATGTRLRG